MPRKAVAAPDFGDWGKKVETYDLEKLGFDFPDTGDWLRDQLQIEMFCFRIGHSREFGGRGKFGHFKRIVDLTWNNPNLECPVKFVWNPWADKMLREACEQGCEELGVAGPTSAGKSSPFALWAAVNFMVDPTHVKVLVMSTTIDGAKLRIWKSFREFVNALPMYPGKQVWSANRILGPDYDHKTYGEGSGVQLLASEKSKEKEALEKMIGIKSPRTGDPDYSLPALKARFPDLAAIYDDYQLADLLPRLMNVMDDRLGKILLIVDEATGLPESLLSAINLNMKPGNVGTLQCVFLGNPNLHFDSFGRFCEPKVGWENVSLNDSEWETRTGGKCIRFNGEENPRLTEKNDRYSWMLTQDRIDGIARDCGGKASLGYYRMVLGMWSPEGSESAVYTQADVENMGSMDGKPVFWGLKAPTQHSSLDCAFTSDGDRAFCTFGRLGVTADGLQVLERTETMVLQIDLKSNVPVNHQIVRAWKKECQKRKIPPYNACYDASGGGIVFGDIVKMEWSDAVQGITASGSPIERPEDKGKEDQTKFSNRATQIWYTAHPFFRSGQIKGISVSLAKEICSRRPDEGSSTADGRHLKIESKRIFKRRTGQSPDESDSFFLLVEHCRMRHSFKPAEKAVRDPGAGGGLSQSWQKLKDRARRIIHKKNLSKA